MSVINEVYAIPSRVRGVFRLLLHAENYRLDRELLENTLSPLVIASTPDTDEDGLEVAVDKGNHAMVRGVINEMIKMGLLECDNDGRELSIPNQFLSEIDLKKEGERLSGIISKLFLSSDNNENHDFARLATWFLCQDAYEPLTWESVRVILLEQVGEGRLGCTNKSRFDQFTYWSTYLGFCWSYDIEKKTTVFVPDPTTYLRTLLPYIFSDSKSLLIRDVNKRLADLCPLFEGGTFRNELNETYQVETRENHYLSTATSIAWLRLQEEGEIELEHKSDAEMFIFPGAQQDYRYSGITWKQKGVLT